MSKKHFNALAAAMKAGKPSPDDTLMFRGEISQWKRDCKQVADVCSNHNPQFDYYRFLAACGYND